MSRRGQAGQSLPELLIAMLIGLVVAGGATTVVVGATRKNDDITRRNAAAQQARTGMDSLVRLLRSQVCVPTGLSSNPVTPLLAGTDTSITFYAAYGDQYAGTATSMGTYEKHVVTLDETTRRLTDTAWRSTGSPPAFPSTPTSTRLLASNVAAFTDGTGVRTAPLRYFAYDGSTTDPKPNVALPTPLSTTDAKRVARISLTLQALPEGTQDGTRRVTLEDDVLSDLTDPDGTPEQTCS